MHSHVINCMWFLILKRWRTCGLHGLNVDSVGLVQVQAYFYIYFFTLSECLTIKEASLVIPAYAWRRDNGEIKIFNLHSCSSHVRPDRCLQATVEHFTAAVRLPKTWSRILFHKVNKRTIPQKWHTVVHEVLNQTQHSYKKSNLKFPPIATNLHIILGVLVYECVHANLLDI